MAAGARRQRCGPVGQGPKSKEVRAARFGPSVLEVRYIWAMAGELGGIPVLIRRSAWLEEVMERREAQAGSARAVHITDLGCPFS